MLPIPGGISLKKRKNKKMSIENIDKVTRVYLKMSLGHSPCVSIGEKVKIGQTIAFSQDDNFGPVFSSVSGSVEDIHDDCIIIKNDFKDIIDPELSPVSSPILNLKTKDIADLALKMGLFDGGVMLSQKILQSSGKIENLIIRCFDSQNSTSIGEKILEDHLTEILSGIKILIHATNARLGIIVVDERSKGLISMLKESISDPALITYRTVENKYPIENEKVLIFALTRKEHPTEGLTQRSKCLTLDVETVLDIYKSFSTGVPKVNKYFSIDGGVKDPKILSAPIGTPFEYVFGACGGIIYENAQIIQGGIMSGVEKSETDIVTNLTNAISVIERQKDKETACIRCGKCINVCPMLLKPLYLYANAQNNKLAQNEKLGVKQCISCGCCSYICPSKIPLFQTFKNSSHNFDFSPEKE